jgi:hypothetical protein
LNLATTFDGGGLVSAMIVITLFNDMQKVTIADK